MSIELNDYMELLPKIQETQTEILLEFHNFCELNDIQYTLAFGTLLGAIRHKGFIPWDDDIDLTMDRENYNRFLELNKQGKYSSNYFVQNYLTDESIFPFTKIRKNGTKMIMESSKNESFHQGAWIDIFPIDEIPRSGLPSIVRKYKSAFYIGAVTSNSWSKVSASKNIANKIVRGSLFYANKILGRNFLVKKCENHLTKKFDNPIFAGLTETTFDSGYPIILEDLNLINDVILWEFNGNEFWVPRNYDEILSNIYGDYMELPTKENRFPHHKVLEVKL